MCAGDDAGDSTIAAVAERSSRAEAGERRASRTSGCLWLMPPPSPYGSTTLFAVLRRLAGA